MDLKILVLLLVILFISIEALPKGGGSGGNGSGGRGGISRGGSFRGGNKPIKVKGFTFEDGDGSDDLSWLWIILGILGFIIICILILVCFKNCC